MKHLLRLLVVLFALSLPTVMVGQQRCATMSVLESKFNANPALRAIFNERQTQFQKIVNERVLRNKSLRTDGLAVIPVVFHVVSRNNQNIATDAQLIAQLDTINKDYSGTNAGESKVPDHFRALFGQSGIRFALAQRTPQNVPTSGIVRYTTTRNSFTDSNENIKHAAQGGADAWNTNDYLNIWVCDLGSQTLGYSTFPDQGTPQDEQGVVIHYQSLPGSSNNDFNGGKTLTHEIGHYFNLYHIWGDDNGACSGSDRVEDTPNQGDANRTTRTGIVTDNCSTSSPGIMYQNYMDYSPDVNLLMFTKLQVARMEAAYTAYRSSFSSSLGATPVNLKKNDASITAITQPEQRLCFDSFAPQVILRNMGSEVLRSVTITAVIEGGNSLTYNWTGSLTAYNETTVMLPSLQTAQGNHVLTIFTTMPNNVADEDASNDARTFNYIYYEPVAAPVIESFEGAFLPEGWDIVNADGGNTWEKTTVGSKTGQASVRISNYATGIVGQRDFLRSPTVNIAGVDSAFVSFNVAAATYNTGSSQSGSSQDTLQVLVSTNCGKTYTSVYKKWGSSLVTRTANTRTAFVPASSEWRTERINISSFVNAGDILVAFVNTSGNGNDVFLDDININTVTVNPNLKEAGFLVTPNPTDGAVSVQFYPHPVGLTGINIYNVSGQLVKERVIPSTGVSANVYDFDLSNYAAGLYIVKAIFTDRVLTKKVVKVK